MTVTYSLDVSSARFLSFTKLIFRWRGSIYKLMTHELLIFALLYYIILLINRFGLSSYQQGLFADICLYFRHYLDLVPITFVLGFYVSVIVTRWWNIYMNLPWVDRTCVLVGTYVRGNDERGRMIRRTLARYANILAILCLRCVSTQAKRRFPTLDHLVESNVITEAERKSLDSVNRNYGEYFQPVLWFGSLLSEARKEGRIADDIYVRHIMAEIGDLRSWMGNLLSYDWVSVPLVYTQVVSIAVYMFFFGCLFGRQFVHQEDSVYWVSQYFPLFTFIQFFFYMGWLKVAEVLINPLGEDDDDFEINYIIDRNITIGFLMVDDLYGKHPPMERDAHWDDSDPIVPYTEAAKSTYIEPFLGSMANVEVPEKLHEWAPVEEDVGGSNSGSSHNLAGAMRKFTRTFSALTGGQGEARHDSQRNKNRTRRTSAAAIAANRKKLSRMSSQTDSLTSSVTTQGQNNPAFDDEGVVTDAIVSALALADQEETHDDDKHEDGRKKVSWSKMEQGSNARAEARKLSGRNEELKPERRPSQFDTLDILAEEDEESGDLEMTKLGEFALDEPMEKADRKGEVIGRPPFLNGFVPTVNAPQIEQGEGLNSEVSEDQETTETDQSESDQRQNAGGKDTEGIDRNGFGS